MVKTYSRRRGIRGGGWWWDSSGNTSSENTSLWNPSSWNLPDISSLNPFSSSSTQTSQVQQPYTVAQTQPSYPVASTQMQSTGGRRHRKKMRGGDFMPNSPLSGFASDAMEVHDIKMAQPQTLVGGRRRRRKSSKRRGRTARKSRRKV